MGAPMILELSKHCSMVSQGYLPPALKETLLRVSEAEEQGAWFTTP